MNVLFVSQCSKRALGETRRILDQFAERYGTATWQTHITEDGLLTVRKLLKKTARKNTAVACHQVRGKHRTELLWIVGDASVFNERGIVPTNVTYRNILRQERENDWHTLPLIEGMAAIASLFHDFGKASKAFQEKLQMSLKNERSHPEAYRHEWVSLRLFEAFVNGDTDTVWLQRLVSIADDMTNECLDRLRCDPKASSPFKTLRGPLAQAIGWLIVSHHRLLCSPQGTYDRWAYALNEVDPAWNDAGDRAKSAEPCWSFAKGIPLNSVTWRKRANYWGQQALQHLQKDAVCIFDDVFSLHLARLSLMLADHYYSMQPSQLQLGDKDYPLYANTRICNGKTQKNQRLDEHLIGVEKNARRVAKALTRLPEMLPRLARHSGLKRRETLPQFQWQNKAFDLACAVRDRTVEQGFFGINMASTGCGKTLANARIMYGLANPQKGARFSIALGLRTLTLQTGEAYRDRLKLDDTELAVVVGSQAVQQLFAQQKDAVEMTGNVQTASIVGSESPIVGSESAQSLLDDSNGVIYEGQQDAGPLSHWLKHNLNAQKILVAPILVCTIDQLIDATEGVRGGRQIIPMLRLLSADLVLDEPDDFSMEDLPALTRFVHWAGMLGSRVLLSSATLPQALIEGLFAAYCDGRALFQKSRGIPGRSVNVVCGWFDEWSAVTSEHASGINYQKAHQRFVLKRLERLAQTAVIRRRAIIQPVVCRAGANIYAEVAQLLHTTMQSIHSYHHSIDAKTQKQVSFGLVRFANIGPLVAVAKHLIKQAMPEGWELRVCCYHSQYPLLLRSQIERILDCWLNRQSPDKIFAERELRQILDNSPAQKIIFVVLATSVAEVGRDHDYDWAIVEPSSMRSIIQLAGRVKRHREEECAKANIYLLNRNIRTLQCEDISYCKPGFESKEYRLHTHDLQELLEENQYTVITPNPRIMPRDPLRPAHNLVDLEHHRLQELMERHPWLKERSHLFGQVQKQSAFRKEDGKRDTYALLVDEESACAKFYLVPELKKSDTLFQRYPLVCAPGVFYEWVPTSYENLLQQQAEYWGMDIGACAQRFGVVMLRQQNSTWYYHSGLGVFEDTDCS